MTVLWNPPDNEVDENLKIKYFFLCTPLFLYIVYIVLYVYACVYVYVHCIMLWFSPYMHLTMYVFLYFKRFSFLRCWFPHICCFISCLLIIIIWFNKVIGNCECVGVLTVEGMYLKLQLHCTGCICFLFDVFMYYS